ncbi:hypothetical protein SPRG_06372 [Saprolegnia parasitica CBS 223.65]|uniref:HMG box domain-containing protein n=1 Tax=Saprolegnia parasitica (strain CBS 223.65) TaxID=695850 RepID=A0A067CNC9_SAPPC|nr:hypothetical protein SPRG_06372 [Saprolegnia parasitica CBS 223.65]KDO28322.1 hypothetical protein SPRG_06372 [Saprolegnia parasitica CBS 223.65]|eukprot:XP_012201141.1 hypothetical protein SPRG_06372 [Saprolegnia parasitica CBS 223.65]
MGPKKGNMNSKAAAANERKAANDAEKNKKKSAQAEAAAAAEWAQGADARGSKRQQEEELKRQQADAKKAELKRLQEEEEAALSGVKAKAKTKNMKDMDKPWELALEPTGKKSNKGSRAKPASAPRVVADPAPARPAGRHDIVFNDDIDLHENKNRHASDALEATSVEDALALLSTDDKGNERHPERRAKAAYKAFEEATMPQLKEDYPGLKLSQYKQRLSDMWRKSPQNPLNQDSKAYNAKN